MYGQRISGPGNFENRLMQSSSILHSRSFHPIFKTTISAPGFSNCSLHLHYALPPIVFVDPYELSNRADASSFKYAGPSSLELPVFALDAKDEDAGLLVSITRRLPEDGALDVEVPLHVRYGKTAANRSPFQLTTVPWPDAFLACPASSSSSSDSSGQCHPQDASASAALTHKQRPCCPQCSPNSRRPSTGCQSCGWSRRIARCR
jgi:hypothetical protein